jgi:geranylgeranyl reductase family protein
MVLDFVFAHPIISLVAGVVLYFVAKSVLFSSKPVKRSIPKGKYNDKNKEKEFYDVAIVGAGPSGATMAYYLAKGGIKPLVLEKKQFPRDKYCGDAVCKTAIEILMDMGLYEKLIKENKAKVADSGGLVSPGGISYIGRSHEQLGEIPAAIAIKRLLLDEAIARRCQEVGADLKENSPVADAKFDKEKGLWTVILEDGVTTYQARTLVCADGATSKLAMQLGVVKGAPNGACSRAFVEGGTHNLKADGVVFYNTGLLPGYAALFKHPNDELNYCCYLIPGNPLVTNDDLAYWHEYLIKEDPNVSKALGNKFKIERMRAGSLRLGGVPTSSGDHLLIVGDAAGMIDPLTGEGIHHAMEGGKIAAEFMLEAIAAGNFSAEAMQIYHERWMERFGNDFTWSMNICQFLYRFPVLIDAATAAVRRKGDKFLARWADIMTGRVPKTALLKPEFVIVITFELFILLAKKLTGQYKGVIYNTGAHSVQKKKTN